MKRFLLLIAACLGLYWLIYIGFAALTDVSGLRTEYPRVIYKGPKSPLEVVVDKKKPAAWTRLTEVSRPAVSAILMSEDAAFWQHNGFDFDQIWEAAKMNWEKKRFARGGSTITQQVAKNVFLSSEKTLLRKFAEGVFTMRLERQLSKRRILEIYLNIAEFGEGLFGIGPAARFYFEKSPSELSYKEGAFLAMLLPSPKKYSVSFRKKELTPYAKNTVNSILNKLAAAGTISEEELAQIKATPLSIEKTAAPSVEQAAGEPVPDDDDLPEEN